LPTDLVERIRDFADKDRRSLKITYERAIEYFLATHVPSADTVPISETTDDARTNASGNLGKYLANRTEEEFQKIRSQLPKEGRLVADRLREGLLPRDIAGQLEIPITKVMNWMTEIRRVIGKVDGQ
jgi:DNA-directed RNA polymerase specialized sigma24 family protein